jgi:hypothetical protein
MPDNVNVKPSTDATAVSVATDDVDGVHYPIYKLAIGADGSASLIDDEENAIPIKLNSVSFAQQEDLIDTVHKLNTQLRIISLVLQEAFDVRITEDDISCQ